MENVYEVIEWVAWIYSAVALFSIVIFIVSQQESFNCSYEGYRQKRDFKNRKMNYFNFRYIPDSSPRYCGYTKNEFRLLGNRSMWSRWTLFGLFVANPIIGAIWLATYLKVKKDFYLFVDEYNKSEKDSEMNEWLDRELLKPVRRR